MKKKETYTYIYSRTRTRNLARTRVRDWYICIYTPLITVLKKKHHSYIITTIIPLLYRSRSSSRNHSIQISRPVSSLSIFKIQNLSLQLFLKTNTNRNKNRKHETNSRRTRSIVYSPNIYHSRSRSRNEWISSPLVAPRPTHLSLSMARTFSSSAKDRNEWTFGFRVSSGAWSTLEGGRLGRSTFRSRSSASSSSPFSSPFSSSVFRSNWMRLLMTQKVSPSTCTAGHIFLTQVWPLGAKSIPVYLYWSYFFDPSLTPLCSEKKYPPLWWSYFLTQVWPLCAQKSTLLVW